MFSPVNSQPDFPAQEEEILAFWQSEGIFEKSVEKNKDKKPFVIYDGPPTANAKPPLHTAVPMSFKDLVGRYQTMKGRYVPRQAGWDTHGLPVEVQVEKALGLASKKDVLNLVPGDEAASIQKFNEICRQSVWEFKQEWDKFVPRVGYWTDVKNPYVTYDSAYIEKVWGVFKRVWDKQLVFKDYKVLPYCPRCGTGLSAAEVTQGYQDVKDVSVFVTFPIIEKLGVSFLAWTTTPWTLPGNVALAVGDNIEYVEVLQKKDEKEVRLILAKARLSVLVGEYEIVAEYTGKDLLGLHYQPLYSEVLKNVEGKKFEVVSADFVTTEDGSGIVHTAVMYGEDDFNLGKKEGLAAAHSVGLDGRFLENVPEFAGLYVKDALVPILKSLTEKGALYAKQQITHSYPHCWRCKTALLYYAKDSWYIGMSKLRKELVESNSKVEWYPEHIKDGRFGDFVKEARDWAISRERFWGTPLPIWQSEEGDYICVGSFDELRSLAKNPENIPADFDPHRPFIDAVELVKDGKTYQRQPFVLDVWFDSGAMPFASGRAEQGLFPADYIAEAVDQTRGWFYSLMAISTILEEKSPYKCVVCMGHLVDEHGKKMSKSVGNIFDPWETFSICGMDAIRWFLYTVNSPGEAKSFTVKDLQTSFRKSILLLWNVFNYYITYANTNGFETLTLKEIGLLSTTGKFRDEKLTDLDRWILSRQAHVSGLVGDYLNEYDFMRAGRTLEQYINELSTWYLRRSRKRNDKAFFAVMHTVLFNLVSLMAPFTPFVTEKIYQVLRHEDMAESIHLTEWVGQTGSRDQKLEDSMALVQQAVELGLALRSQEKMKVRQPLRTAYVSLENHSLSPELLQILAEELNVMHVEMGIPEGYPSKQEGTITVALDTVLDESLIQAGASRDLLRHIQNLRKNKGLQPGESVQLVVGPMQRSLVEPLLSKEIISDAFLLISEDTWMHQGDTEIELLGETVWIGFKDHVESV
jgi:isoleucyl-tRNA synthetase